MKDRLYVTDLDGTLLNSSISLSDYTIKTLNQLIEAGMPITYSTARSYYTTAVLLKQVNFRLPCINYNGVYVTDAGTGNILHKNLLSRAVYDEVMAVAEARGLKAFVFGVDHMQEEKLLYETEHYIAHTQFIEERKKRNDKRLTKTRISDYPLVELINVNFLYPKDVIFELEQTLRQRLGETVSIKVIKDIYNKDYYTLEVSNINANKGKMLQYICEYLDVKMDNVSVFGDQANDKEMFEQAGIGVAVENANPELKKIADKIIDSNDQDGVAKYLFAEFYTHQLQEDAKTEQEELI